MKENENFLFFKIFQKFGVILKALENLVSPLENKFALQNEETKEKTIERERIKVIDRPVYSNECLDVDGLQLVERARRGKTDTSQPTDKVSGAN